MSLAEEQAKILARRPTWAEIDLNNLAANFTLIRQRVTPAARVMAVLKANAYGHGRWNVHNDFRAKAPTGLALRYPKREFNFARQELKSRSCALQVTGLVRLLLAFNIA